MVALHIRNLHIPGSSNQSRLSSVLNPTFPREYETGPFWVRCPPLVQSAREGPVRSMCAGDPLARMGWGNSQRRNGFDNWHLEKYLREAWKPILFRSGCGQYLSFETQETLRHILLSTYKRYIQKMLLRKGYLCPCYSILKKDFLRTTISSA